MHIWREDGAETSYASIERAILNVGERVRGRGYRRVSRLDEF